MEIQKFFAAGIRVGVTLMVFGVLSGCTAGAAKPGTDRAETLYLNAVSHYANRSLDEAATELRGALAADPLFFQAEFLLGKVLFFQGQEEAALTTFAALHKRLPQYTEARLWHIRCLILSQKYDDAQVLLDEETAFNPGDWRVYYHCAQIANLKGDRERHIAELRSAATFLEDGGRVYVDLAKVWYGLGLEDRARSYVERSAALAGSDGPLAESLDALHVALNTGGGK